MITKHVAVNVNYRALYHSYTYICMVERAGLVLNIITSVPV